MRRFFLPPENFDDMEIPLTEECSHYFTNVLRLNSGEEALLLDGQGLVCRCRIEASGRKLLKAHVIEKWREPDTTFPFHLIQALPKAEKMDLILQKGTELGVREFSPVITSRSVPNLSNERLEHRVLRWQRIVREAARQSGRSFVPIVNKPLDVAGVLLSCREKYRLVCWEEESRPLADILSGVTPRDAAVFVGPEGGLVEKEIRELEKAGFQAVSLGPRILRTETAGFTVAAIFQYLYGDMGLPLKAKKINEKGLHI